MTVIVAGSINLDMIARVPRLPNPGETLTGLGFATAQGGKGANQALAARRAGADVRMIGAVGGDANAAPALALLKQAGINLEAVLDYGQTVPTGVAMILVDEKTGENEIVVIPGANACMKADPYEHLWFTSTWVLLLQMEIPASYNKGALRRARDDGATSIINIAPYDHAAINLAMMADITIANETEFDLLADDMKLTGASRESRAERFVAETGNTMIVTLGGAGAFAATVDGLTSVAAPSVEPVDTVGAGDTFCGYFGAALYEGMPMTEALKLACRAGALACLQHGAQPSIPTREEVNSFVS